MNQFAPAETAARADLPIFQSSASFSKLPNARGRLQSDAGGSASREMGSRASLADNGHIRKRGPERIVGSRVRPRVGVAAPDGDNSGIETAPAKFIGGNAQQSVEKMLPEARNPLRVLMKSLVGATRIKDIFQLANEPFRRSTDHRAVLSKIAAQFESNDRRNRAQAGRPEPICRAGMEARARLTRLEGVGQLVWITDMPP